MRATTQAVWTWRGRTPELHYSSTSGQNRKRWSQANRLTVVVGQPAGGRCWRVKVTGGVASWKGSARTRLAREDDRSSAEVGTRLKSARGNLVWVAPHA